MHKSEMSPAELPIVVGVTGHRDLSEIDVPKLKLSVENELRKLKEKYPNSPFIMLNSLAAGGDLLCAEVALKQGIKLKCPLPMAPEEYSHDFEGEDLALFKTVLAEAESVFVAPATEKLPEELRESSSEPPFGKEERNYFYRQAGLYVAYHSHVLFALWDGSPANPKGCGTAETVDFMLHGRYDGAVLHFMTPRKSNESGGARGVTLIEREADSLDTSLRITDTFNKDSQAIPSSPAGGLLPREVLKESDSFTQKLHRLYQESDGLSMHFQGKYLSVLKWLSIFGVALVLAFLLYDEFESDLFLPIYGVCILLSLWAFRLAGKGDYHSKYLQYRVLAEALRIQVFLSAFGINKNIGEAFTWTQKQDSVWVKATLSALLIGSSSKVDGTQQGHIKVAWIDDQLDYHTKAALRNEKKRKINRDTARLMLVLSIVLFVVVFTAEFAFKQAMLKEIPVEEALRKFLIMHEEQEISVRGLLKILLGGISAVTLFLSSYYGKLSLDRKVSDHRKMSALYGLAQSQYENSNIPKEDLLWELAREEIIENGNWYSYCRDNAPGINI